MMTSRPSRPVSRFRIRAERVQPIGIDDERRRRANRQASSRTASSLAAAHARSNHDDVAGHLEQLIDAVGIEPSSWMAQRVGHVLGRLPATIAWQSAGVAMVTRPAPERSAPIPGEVRGAGPPFRIRRRSESARSRLVAVRRARRHEVAGAGSCQSSTRGPSMSLMTSTGMPMSAMTMSPARTSAGMSTSGSLGRASVTVVPASIDSPIGKEESAERPDGKVDGDHGNIRPVDVGDHAFDQAADRRVEAGAEDRVDDDGAVATSEWQLPRLTVRHFHHGDAEPARGYRD